MTSQLSTPYRLMALKCVLFQVLVAFLLVVIVFIGWNTKASLSALIGSLVSIIPNMVFAFYAFRYVGADQTNRVYTSLKRGNVLKFMLTVALFILVLKNQMVELLPFFCVYVLVLFSGLFAPVFTINIWNRKWQKN